MRELRKHLAQVEREVAWIGTQTAFPFPMAIIPNETCQLAWGQLMGNEDRCPTKATEITLGLLHGTGLLTRGPADVLGWTILCG